MTVLLVLTACGNRESVEKETEELQKALSEAENLRFVAALRADYGERVYDYRVRFAGLGGEGMLTILEPESVAGAAVRYGADGTALSYDGAEVYTGELLPQGLSPVDALPMMVNAWRTGLVTGAVRESFDGQSCLAVDFMIAEDVSLRTWFQRESALPLHAEVSFDGYTVLEATFFDFAAE